MIFEGPANHFLSGEGRGGWLTLTSTRLVFRSHGNNLQNGTLHLGLDQMLSVTPRRTILFIPYRLRVHRTDGGNETFVVQDGMDWAKRIAEQIERVRQNRCA